MTMNWMQKLDAWAAVVTTTGALAASLLAAPSNGEVLAPQAAVTAPEVMSRMCADRDALFQGRIAFIQAKLGVGAQQKDAFEQFVAAAKSAHAKLDICEQGPPPFNDPIAMRARFDEFFEKLHEAHGIVKAAADKLSLSLDPDQRRKLAEALLPAPGKGFGALMGLPPMGPPGAL